MTDQFHAKTFKGLEQLLARELESIGADNIKVVNRGVNFSGSMAMLYKANLYLRTAIRVLMPISRFKAVNEQQLYRQIRNINWSEYMTYKNSLAIDAVAFSDIFRNSHFVEQKVKDAIVDQFREKTNIRPTVDKRNADIRINIHIQNNIVLVSLDSSGESLHRRGYKREQHRAALNEVLAAGMVMLAGYNGDEILYNPMCGSGTIALEAAMIAMDIFPGSLNRKYALQNWQNFDPVLFERLRENMPVRKDLKNPIFLSDIDPDAIRMSKANARILGLDKILSFTKEDFLQSDNSSGAGMLIMNPPYGERLEVEDINNLYSEIGTRLKHEFPGNSAWIFSSSIGALKYVGLKAEKKITLYNASLECRYTNYKLFSGDRKSFLSERK